MLRICLSLPLLPLDVQGETYRIARASNSTHSGTDRDVVTRKERRFFIQTVIKKSFPYSTRSVLPWISHWSINYHKSRKPENNSLLSDFFSLSNDEHRDTQPTSYISLTSSPFGYPFPRFRCLLVPKPLHYRHDFMKPIINTVAPGNYVFNVGGLEVIVQTVHPYATATVNRWILQQIG
ncbi:hypothetical protein F5146DRAFT_743148 [Armillaria mellea]|nr:hypothetical protein F5146DRAFT_743148 [Armillaria mellea]